MKRIVCLLLLVITSGNVWAQTYLPYPIIFIHGLAGDHQSWNEARASFKRGAWKDGGILPYFLNADEDPKTCLLSHDVWQFVPDDLQAADFYTITFNTLPNGAVIQGENEYLSNQSGIFKQGIAIDHAVSRVLEVTQKEKVILVGHSMGGLAARTYLQFYPDAPNRVAKYISIGTPHWGVYLDYQVGNAIAEWYIGIDFASEAVRDLTNEYQTGVPGLFLYGGTEDEVQVRQEPNLPFYNVDVNCDGLLSNFIGLNNKGIPDIDFANVIGNWTFGDNGDGVVSLEQADLHWLYPQTNMETFYVNANHLELPEELLPLYQALDEPDDFKYAYNVSIGDYYFGYVTTQAINNTRDSDVFSFDWEESGELILEVTATDKPDFWAYIINANGQYIERFEVDGQREVRYATFLEAGRYYLQMDAAIDPSPIEQQFNYYFKLDKANRTTNTEDPGLEEWTIAPNPASSYVSLSGTHQLRSYQIINAMGQLVQKGWTNGRIGIEQLPTGAYVLLLAEGVRWYQLQFQKV